MKSSSLLKYEGGRGSVENTRGSGRFKMCEDMLCDGVECLECEGVDGERAVVCDGVEGVEVEYVEVERTGLVA